MGTPSGTVRHGWRTRGREIWREGRDGVEVLSERPRFAGAAPSREIVTVKTVPGGRPAPRRRRRGARALRGFVRGGGAPRGGPRTLFGGSTTSDAARTPSRRRYLREHRIRVSRMQSPTATRGARARARPIYIFCGERVCFVGEVRIDAKCFARLRSSVSSTRRSTWSPRGRAGRSLLLDEFARGPLAVGAARFSPARPFPDETARSSSSRGAPRTARPHRP